MFTNRYEFDDREELNGVKIFGFFFYLLCPNKSHSYKMAGGQLDKNCRFTEHLTGANKQTDTYKRTNTHKHTHKPTRHIRSTHT